jgi:alanyl-tRNA synthetase
MGAGLERWGWFSQATPMSYDTVFPEVMKYLYRESGVKPDKKLWSRFARYAGLLSFDEIEDAGKVWRQVAAEVDVPLEELKQEVFCMRALYAIADHTRTLLVGIHDGALPSNVGGGYNLRNILRRCWTLMDEYEFSFDLTKVFEEHIKEFGSWYTELAEVGSLWDILSVEKERFEEGKRKARAVVGRMIAEREKFTAEKLAELYDSQGIHPNTIREIKKDLTIPDNFYKLVEERHERSKALEEKKTTILSRKYPDTKTAYYENMNETSFKAKVMAVEGDYVILDQTLFYPEGGGQEADRGTLNGVSVLDVQKEGKVILHKVEDALKFKAEATVSGCVDAERRKQLTQHHTATHIINAAAYRVLGPHLWQAGAHKSADIARLDVTHYKAISNDELRRIEDEAGRIVSEGIAVKKMVLPRDEAEKRYGFRIYQGGAVPGTELRIIEILGVDAEACGGTHLDNTREVGKIKVVKATRIQDGVVRIEFKAGNAADKESSKGEELFKKAFLELPVKVKDSSYNPQVLQEACNTFGVQPEQLPQTIKRFVAEWQETGVPVSITDSSTLATSTASLFEGWKQARKKREKEASGSADALASELEEAFASKASVKKITEGLPLPSLMKTAAEAAAKPGRVLVLVNVAGDKCNVVVASSNPKVNAGEVAAELSAKLGGGGRGDGRLGVGGGKSTGVEKILSELKLQ